MPAQILGHPRPTPACRKAGVVPRGLFHVPVAGSLPACLVPRLFYPAAPRPGPAPAPLSQAKAAPTPHGGRRNGRQVCAGPTHHSFPEVKAVGRRTAAPNRALRDTPAPAPHAGLPPRPALLPSARRKECRRYRGGARRAPCGPLPSCRGCSAVP